MVCSQLSSQARAAVCGAGGRPAVARPAAPRCSVGPSWTGAALVAGPARCPHSRELAARLTVCRACTPAGPERPCGCAGGAESCGQSLEAWLPGAPHSAAPQAQGGPARHGAHSGGAGARTAPSSPRGPTLSALLAEPQARGSGSGDWAQPGRRAGAGPGGGPGGPGDRGEEYYANVGDAIRTLRAEVPYLFERELSMHIYTDNLVFRDSARAIQGKKTYQTVLWSLRFHSKLFFRRTYVDVTRIWQDPRTEDIKLRWTAHGYPRVVDGSHATFDAVSIYKLDRNGRIYEHQVDNVILGDPPAMSFPVFAGNGFLTPAMAPPPMPGAYFEAPEQLGGV